MTEKYGIFTDASGSFFLVNIDEEKPKTYLGTVSYYGGEFSKSPSLFKKENLCVLFSDFDMAKAAREYASEKRRIALKKQYDAIAVAKKTFADEIAAVIENMKTKVTSNA